MSWWFGRKSSPDGVSPLVPTWLRAREDEGFACSTDGLNAYVRSSAATAVYHDGGWEIGNLKGSQVTIAGQKVLGPRSSAIAAPAGGGTVDAETRAAIGQILTAMRSHGLIET